jgi:hypothetical protein
MTSIEGGTSVKAKALLWVLVNSKPVIGSRRIDCSAGCVQCIIDAVLLLLHLDSPNLMIFRFAKMSHANTR